MGDRLAFWPSDDDHIDELLRSGRAPILGVSEQLIAFAQEQAYAEKAAAVEEESLPLWHEILFEPLSADDAGWGGLGLGIGALYAGKTGAPVAGLLAILAGRIAKARSR
jgi:hypothetical protein